MSKHQSDRQEDIQSAGQTERQNASMADSRAAKEPALVRKCAMMLVFALDTGICIMTGFGYFDICLGLVTSYLIPI